MAGMKVTIGGNRVGSGQKMNAELHNYFRSTHNLSEKWASSMGSGILYPAMVKLALRGDVFDIGINADARTIPTKGPLFGSYKMQIDVFQCPIRLYQALLHNNPLAIGLKMNQVKLPVITCEEYVNTTIVNERKEVGEFSKSCLMKYLGVSGMGHTYPTLTELGNKKWTRDFNALPMLSYYDIFKTYYANKQEANAYAITGTIEATEPTINTIQLNGVITTHTAGSNTGFRMNWEWANNATIVIKGTNLNPAGIQIELKDENAYELISMTLKEYAEKGLITIRENTETTIIANLNESLHYYTDEETQEETALSQIVFTEAEYNKTKTSILQEFDLSNIDDMRYDILSAHTLGTPFKIDYTSLLPYSLNCSMDEENKTLNRYPLNGLVLKTYQNDIYNNWLNAAWIEGEGSIADLTKVQIVDGAFSMDALSFAQKLYNMLNRVAVTDGTYESWQDVMYEQIARKQIESPIFLGGMSQEIMFDEIVQTAPADGDPLGTLGGRGRLVGTKKGGKIHVKVDEASFIIAIVSLTPRIFYTQGNEFYMTDLFSMDDLHKPGMDCIGYQDLIAERMAWWDTTLNQDGTIKRRAKIGKLPAWIEYMTSTDKAFGDFAEEYGVGYMILNRNYERSNTLGIKDATTYIDPAKYNYAFAYSALDAQNFWVEIAFDIKARRKMSARLIPSV